jgi:hypothetical protein
MHRVDLIINSKNLHLISLGRKLFLLIDVC